MPKKPATQKRLLLELKDLRARLDEAEETLRAIRSSEVDALVVSGASGEQLFTLKGADRSYRILIEDMSQGALTLTAEGVILYANQSFAEMLKTPLEKVIGSAIHAWIAPDSQRILQSLLRKGLDERRCEQLELTAGDGTPVPVYLSVSNLLINGMLDSFCLVATDLTEQRRSDAIVASEKLARELLAASNQSRLALQSVIEEQKQAEKALLASEVRYRRLFETAQDGILILDARTGMILDANPFLITMVGFSLEQFHKQTIWDIGFFKDIIANKDIFLELQKKGYNLYEDLTLEAADGRRIDAEFVSNIYEIDHQKVIQCNIRDITERKLAEKALRENERRLKEAQEMAHLGYWCWDVNTGDVEWSEEVYKIFRLDPEEFTPHIDSILALSPWPIDHERDKELINRAIESHETGSYEQKFFRPDKSVGYYYSNFQGNYDEKGDLISIVGTVMDITDRKRAENEIRALNTELEQRVIKRTAQLEAANKELEAFAYSVAHDLRAPLRAIDSFTQILIENLAEKLDSEDTRLLNVVRTNTQKMDLLITDLLSLSRASLTEMSHTAIDMTALAMSVYREITPPEVVEKFNYTVGPLPAAVGDPALMRQVWINLISNAVKYTMKSDIRKIEVGGRRENGDAIYYIKDTGAGFNPAYTDKLFGVFQRLHSENEFSGSGVGLALVRRIIHRHGGRVWAEGRESEGATFYFSLPVLEGSSV